MHSAVKTLAEQALASTKLVGDDVIASIQAMIAELDRKFSEQVNKIIHHDEFKALEGALARAFTISSITRRRTKS